MQIIYRSLRIGKAATPFYLYKICTMTKDGGSPTASINDPRLTKWGKWLRKYKIDEIPTLVNLIRGDIAIVGPRPDTIEEIQTLDDITRNLIYKVKPGIISPATLWNYKEDAILADKEDPHKYYCKMIKPVKYYLNTWYIKNKTPYLDFKIFFAYCLKLIRLPYLWLNIYPKGFYGRI